MSFESLGLSAALLRAVAQKGYDTPSPIQAKAIPAVLEGRDVLAAAQTGTGKTAGFTLPLLERLYQNPSLGKRRVVRALVLTPTRELCAQVLDSVRTYGAQLPFKAMAVYGGVSINPQKDKLRQGVDILVATPGRLLDHIQQGTVDLTQVDTLVLDEADRMLDMGFIRDIRRIIQRLPTQRQNLLFSATFSEEIRKLASGILSSPVEIEVAPRNTATELVEQVVHPVDRERKRELLSWLIGSNNWRQVLVFARTKHGADRLAKQLERDGLQTAAIHGNKSQGARTRALEDFKRGKVRVLVATEVAARGLDINQLPHVVNFELPNVPEDYVHRIGRTGRAGNEGHAVSLVCVDEHKLLRDIEKVLGKSIPQEIIDGYAPDPGIRPEPLHKARRGRGGKPAGSKPEAKTGKPRRHRSKPRSGNNAGRPEGRSNGKKRANRG